MEIKPLEENVQNILKSGYKISSVERCVEELIYNALDAKASNIAIRINLKTLRIEVIDNGTGVTRENMEIIGQRFSTNKFNSLENLEKRPKFFGYRGESLACIIALSKRVTISSRPKLFDDTNMDSETIPTYKKVFENGKAGTAFSTKHRASEGTTVTVEDFMCKLPVRQLRVSDNELNHIRSNLEGLALMHPNVSMSLRDDTTKRMIFNKHQKYDANENMLVELVPNLEIEHLVFNKISCGKFKLYSLMSLNLHDNCQNHQYLFVNKRQVLCKKLSDMLQSVFQSKKNSKKGPVYMVGINCPRSKFEYVDSSEGKLSVEYKKWDVIGKLIRKLGEKLQKYNVVTPTTKRIEKPEESLRLSNFKGALKAEATMQLPSNKEEQGQVSNSEGKFVSKGQEQSYGIKKFNLPSRTRAVQQKRSANNKFNEEEEEMVKRIKAHAAEEIVHGAMENENVVKEITPEENNSDEIQMEENKADNVEKMTAKNARREQVLSRYFKSAQEEAPLTPTTFRKFRQFEKEIIPNTFRVSDFENLSSIPKNHATSNITDQQHQEFDVFGDEIKQADIFESNEEEPLISDVTASTNFKILFGLKKPKDNQTFDDRSRSKIDFFKNKKNKIPKIFTSTKVFENKRNKEHAFEFPESARVPPISEFQDQQLPFKPERHIFDRKIPDFSTLDFSVRGKFTMTLESRHFKSDPEHLPEFLDRKSTLKNNFHSFDDSRKAAFKYLSRKDYGRNVPETNKSHFRKRKSCPEFKDFNNSRWKQMKRDICTKRRNYYENLDDFASPTFETLKNHQHRYKQEGVSKKSKRISVYSSNGLKSNYNITMSVVTSKMQTHANENYFHRKFQQIDSKLTDILYELHEMKLSGIDNCEVIQSQIVSNSSTTTEEPEEGSPKFRILDDQILKSKEKTMESENVIEETIVSNPRKAKFQSQKSKIVEQKMLNRISPETENIEVIDEVSDVPNNTIEVKKSAIEDLRIIKSSMSSFNLSQFTELLKALDTSIVEPKVPEGWLKSSDLQGRTVYRHLSTGNLTYLTPKEDNLFTVNTRPEYLPKGFSPILKSSPIIEEKVALDTKKTFHETLKRFCLEENENLRLVKWKKYIENIDAETFFNEIYKERTYAEDFLLPKYDEFKAANFKLKKSMIFKTEMVTGLSVVGQFNKMFIIGYAEHENTLFMFDQHAVDERIQLEKLQNEYLFNDGSSAKKYNSKLLHREEVAGCKLNGINGLTFNKRTLEFFGFDIEVKNNTFFLSKIPLCLYNKCQKDMLKRKFSKVIHYAEAILCEISQKNSATSSKILEDIISNEACRGAIMFGDELNQSKCEELLKTLMDCKWPFICAHGRPTMIPLVHLDLLQSITLKKKGNNRPNLRKLLNR